MTRLDEAPDPVDMMTDFFENERSIDYADVATRLGFSIDEVIASYILEHPADVEPEDILRTVEELGTRYTLGRALGNLLSGCDSKTVANIGRVHFSS